MKKVSILAITALTVMSMLFITSCDSPMFANLAAILAAAANNPDAINDLANNPAAQQLTAQQQLANKLQAAGDPAATLSMLIQTATDQPALIADLIANARAVPNPPTAAIAALDQLNEVRNQIIANTAANPSVLSLEEEAIAAQDAMPALGVNPTNNDLAITQAAIQSLHTRLFQLRALVIAANTAAIEVKTDQKYAHMATAIKTFDDAIMDVEIIVFGHPYNPSQPQSQNQGGLTYKSGIAVRETNNGAIQQGGGSLPLASNMVDRVTSQLLGNNNRLTGTDDGIAYKIDRAIAAATALIILQL